jgi:hypothetical protein
LRNGPFQACGPPAGAEEKPAICPHHRHPSYRDSNLADGYRRSLDRNARVGFRYLLAMHHRALPPKQSASATAC